MFFITSTLCLGVLMMIVLILRQLFIGLKRDKDYNLPLPPRLLIGNGSLPIIGHTHYIRWYGFDDTYKKLFRHQNMRTLNQQNFSLCKKLSSFWKATRETFAIFVYAQWRVFVHGPDRTRTVLLEGKLKPSWGYFVPKSLLGFTYPGLLDEEDRDLLLKLLRKPFSHDEIIKMAPDFALVAKTFIDKSLLLLNGGCFFCPIFSGKETLTEHHHKRQNSSRVRQLRSILVTAQSLKEFALDVMTGPILNLYVNSESNVNTTQNHSRMMGGNRQSCLPSKEMLLLWIKRFQTGLIGFPCHMKGNSLQFWRLTEYGRAMNAREKILVEVLYDNLSREVVPPNTTGRDGAAFNSNSGEQRQHGETVVQVGTNIMEQRAWLPYLHSTISDLIRRPTAALFHRRAAVHQHTSTTGTKGDDVKLNVMRDSSVPASNENSYKLNEKKSNVSSQPAWINGIFEAYDENDICLTDSAVAEISLHLWSILDASTSWITLAMYILQNDKVTMSKIRCELEQKLNERGKSGLYTKKVMDEMRCLDALIYETMRLCPQFIGGYWQTSTTVLLANDNLQIPSGSNILLTETSSHSFNLEGAFLGHLPQKLGESYPNQCLFGFLPYNGLEVPIMVLQTKVFLIEIILRCDFSTQGSTSDETSPVLNSCSLFQTESKYHASEDSSESPTDLTSNDTKFSPEFCRQLFQKTPFPEFLHKVKVIERED